MLKKIAFRNTVSLTRIRYQSLLNIQKFHFSIQNPNSIILHPNILLSLTENICIRQMKEQDLATAFDWARQEGWNPGKYEIKALYAADPTGYYILEVNGESAASLSAVKYSDKFAFLGLFIVRPKFRNQGYGSMLWDAVLGNIKTYPSIGLSSVLKQVNRYQASDFFPTFTNSRWKGNPQNITLKKNIKSTSVQLTDQFMLHQLVNYDNKIFSFPRSVFLEKWTQMPESHTLVALDSTGDICGYGVVSRTEEGYKIAPLFANNEVIAKQLYHGLCNFVGKNALVHIDICETNPYAVKLLVEEFRLNNVSKTVQMYKGKLPKTDHEKVFGLTSLEIG